MKKSPLQIAASVSAVIAESRTWRTVFVLLVIAVGYLALTPAPPAGMDLGWDKFNHVAAFTALALTGCLSCPASRSQRIAMLLGLVSYGGVIEIIQLFVPGRACEWDDLFADSIGIACGAVISSYVLSVGEKKLRVHKGKPV